MYVCMYVCMYVSIYLCMYLCMYLCIFYVSSIYLSIYLFIYLFIYLSFVSFLVQLMSSGDHQVRKTFSKTFILITSSCAVHTYCTCTWPLARLWECSQTGGQNKGNFRFCKKKSYCSVLQFGCIPPDVQGVYTVCSLHISFVRNTSEDAKPKVCTCPWSKNCVLPLLCCMCLLDVLQLVISVSETRITN